MSHEIEISWLTYRPSRLRNKTPNLGVLLSDFEPNNYYHHFFWENGKKKIQVADSP